MAKTQPWERQEYETAKTFQYFAGYRDLGRDEKDWILPLEPRKSLRVYAKSIERTRDYIQHISGRNNWQERIAEYDNYITEKIRLQQEREISKMNKNQATIGQQMQTLALKGLLTLAPEELSAGDVGNLAEKGARIERTARGANNETTTIKAEMTGNVGLTSDREIDLSKLSDKELHDLAELTEKLLGD